MPKRFRMRRRRRSRTGKDKSITQVDFYKVTITPGANLIFTNQLSNLLYDAEQLTSPDGQKVELTDYVITVSAFCADDFYLNNVFVQTAGTWTASTSLTSSDIPNQLDSSINDTFAWRQIGKTQKGQIYYGAAIAFKKEYQIRIPRDLLELVNKTSETERLTALLFGITGKAYANQTVTLYYTTEKRYTIKKTGIELR